MNGDHLNVVELLFSDSGIRSIDMYCKMSVLPKAVRKALALWEDIKSLSAYMEMNHTGQRKIDEINELREMSKVSDFEEIPF